MGRGVRDFIEWCFENEQEIKMAVIEKKAGVNNCKYGGVPTNHAFVSDPTANTAIKNVVPVAGVVVELKTRVNGVPETLLIKNPEEWLKVVNWTKLFYDGKKHGDIYRLRYRQNLPVWEICRILRISRKSYFIMKSDILTYAQGIACGLGLVKIKKLPIYRELWQKD